MTRIANVFYVLFVLHAYAEENWKLVFKIATGGPGNVFDLYTSNRTQNVDNPLAQSLTQPVMEHFKSDIVNCWSTAAILQVRLTIHKNGSEVAFFLFDGHGSTKMDWMSRARLMNSSYSDMSSSTSTTPVNAFSIEGLYFNDQGLKRIFYINSNWNGCSNDKGWIMVLDTNSIGHCLWESMYVTQAPFIIYSPLSSSAKYMQVKNDILAESLAIHVKYDQNNFTCHSMCSTPTLLDENTYCYKHCSTDVSGETSNVDVEEKVQQLKKELTIHKKNTTLYKRSLISIYESRTSAKAMGFVGIVVLVFVFGFFIVLDCLNIGRNKYGRCSMNT